MEEYDSTFGGNDDVTTSGPISSSRMHNHSDVGVEMNNDEDEWSAVNNVSKSVARHDDLSTTTDHNDRTPAMQRGGVGLGPGRLLAPPSALKINFNPPPFTTMMNSGSRGTQQSSSVNSDQALLSAVYNTAAISLLVVCVGLCALLFVVLQAFVRPILWALLTSACLFSLKRLLTDVARRRLAEIERAESMLAFQLVLLPIGLVDSCVDWMWALLKRRYRNFIALLAAVLFFNLGTVFSYG